MSTYKTRIDRYLSFGVLVCSLLVALGCQSVKNFLTPQAHNEITSIRVQADFVKDTLMKPI